MAFQNNSFILFAKCGRGRKTVLNLSTAVFRKSGFVGLLSARPWRVNAFKAWDKYF